MNTSRDRLKLPIRIGDVFKSIGQPTVTYVRRKDARFEDTLKSAVQSSGQLCLITGPSKTGKTTLYKKVLSELDLQPLIIRCDESLSPTEFWAKALESIDFARLTELQTSGSLKVNSSAKISGKIGWPWLASIIGEISLGISGETTEGEVKARILANPSPMHIIPILKKLPLCLVVEDYHYLSDTTKRVIFQQWKSFVDEQVSVVVVSTTHHAADMINANKDLLARVCHIEVSRWPRSDLEEIVEKGFNYLQTTLRSNVKELIANESVGLPILTQQCCEQLFIDKGLGMFNGEYDVDFSREDAHRALRNLAKSRYGQLESAYSKLITGPRKRARKYDTYELILSCFAQEPIKFALKKHEIDERLASLDLPPDKHPPPASVASTLNALGRFQSRTEMEMLEWQTDEEILYILEPAFLFYLRWRGIAEIEKSKEVFRVHAPALLFKTNALRDIKFSDSVRFALAPNSAGNDFNKQIELLYEELLKEKVLSSKLLPKPDGPEKK